MRVRPRLVPSARIAANSADLSAARSPVRRWVNQSAYPVQPSTSLRTSVIRTLGSIAFSRMARLRAPVRSNALSISIADRIMRHIRLELECGQEAWTEPAQDGITLGCGDEDVLIRNLSAFAT